MQPEDIDSWGASAHSSFYDQHRHAGYQASGSLPADGPFDVPAGHEPDDFYRHGPFFAPSPPAHPDIVVNPGAMATLSARPSPPHGVAAAKSPPPALKSARQNLRSVSSPAGSSLPVANGTRSNVSTNVHRPPVKNLVSKFNQSVSPTEPPSPGKLRKPAPRHTASSVATIEPLRKGEGGRAKLQPAAYRDQYKGGNGFNGGAGPRRRNNSSSVIPEHGRAHASHSVSSLHSDWGGSGRPLLFGELPGNAQSSDSLGYGIPLDVARQRSGSLDGGTQRPSAVLTYGRSHTTSGAPAFLSSPDTAAPERNASAQDHRRSRSDLGGLPLSPASEAHMNANSIDDFFSQMSASTRAAQNSKIPLPKRRTSTSDSNSSIQSSRTSSALSERRYHTRTPTGERTTNKKLHAGKENTPRTRPVTPSSTRRYAKPGKRSAESPKLPVQVNVPPPTTSPVLRSSRPRQPVSAASTAASRAKMAERLKNSTPANSRIAERLPARTTLQKPKPPRRDLGLAGPSIADRKALIERSMRAQGVHSQRSASRASVKSGSGVVSPSSVRTARSRANTESEQTPGKSGQSRPSHGPKLSLDVKDPPGPEIQAPQTAATEFESEESPVLGIHASYTAQPEPDSTPRPTTQRDSELKEASQDEEEDEADAVNDEDASIDGERSVLDQVMQIRESRSSSASCTDFAEDSPSDKGDSGSINIMLGTTPSLDQSQQVWSRQDQESQNPSIRWSNTSYESSTRGNPFGDDGNERRDSYPYDTYSSVAPEDSISMAIDNHHNDPRSTDWTPRIYRTPAEAHLSIDTNGYNTISKILDCYLSPTPITSEMAHEFKQQLQAVSPHLSHEEWDSRVKTEQFLAGLVRDHTGVNSMSPEDTPKQKTRNQVRAGFLDEYEQALAPEGELSGTAIIYGETELYGKPSRPVSRKNSDEDRPAPPPKDWRYSPRPPINSPSNTTPVTPHEPPVSRLTSPFQPNLPEIQSAGEGLGLSIKAPSSSNVSTKADGSTPPVTELDASTGAMSSPPSPSVYGRPPSISLPGAPTEAGATRPESLDEDAERCRTATPRRSASHSIGRDSEEVMDEQPEHIDPDVLKRLTHRRNVVKELVETELYYFQDMKVVEDIYKGTSYAIHEVTEEDRKTLFGNTAELVAFSLNFLDALRPAAEGIFKLNQAGRWNKRQSFSTSNSTTTGESTEMTERPSERSDKKTRLGAAFLDHLTDMERVYSVYVQNHSAANNRLIEMQKNKQVQIWLNECHNYAGDITTAWSLDALIVKPTQRFLKYTLLLDQIIQCTSATHPDYENLKAAFDGMKALSTRINETKGRKEIVEKIVTRKREKSDGGSIPFSLQKAFGRRTEKFKQQVGLSETVDDPEYDAISQKFGGHFFQLQIVMRDVEKYLEDVEKMVDQNNALATELEHWLDISLPEHPEIESKWRQYTIMVREVTAYGLLNHKDEVRKSVIKPIQVLWELHGKPQKLMQKRKKRLPDYARYKLAKENGTKVDKKTEEVANEFVAVNGTLKDELPLLYAKTKTLIEACQRNLIESQKKWYQVMASKLEIALGMVGQVSDQCKDLTAISTVFNQDFYRVREELERIEGVIRGLREMASFSPAATFVTDDLSLRQRSTFASSKRTRSINSDQSFVLGTPDLSLSQSHSQRQSGNYSHIPDLGNTPLIMDPPQLSPTQPPLHAGRMRAGSTMSSRGPSTPHSLSAQAPGSGYFPPRPATSAGRTGEPGSSATRLSLDAPEQGRSSGQSSFSTQTAQTQHTRSSSIFSSAMPMSDSPTETRDDILEHEGGEEKVMFLAASLFEFNIAHDRREAGFPYLIYVPGEVFDVLGMRGELWLARNQDDPSRTIGWIWEKHFARIFSE